MPPAVSRISALGTLIGAVGLAVAVAACQQPSGESLRGEARQFQQKGELSAAVIKLKNLLEAHPKDLEGRVQLATVYIETGDAVSAEKEIRYALDNGYKGANGLTVLARTLVMQGQFQKVIAETETAAGRPDPELLSLRADAYLGTGKRDEAGQLYDKVLGIKADYPAALIGRGRLAFLAGDREGARKYAEQTLAAAPRNTEALLFKGDLLRAQNENGPALAAYDQVLAINPAHRSAHIEKAYLEIAMGRFTAAQADLDAARKTTPNSLLVAYTQTLLDFSQGKYAAAQESMQKVLRVAPEHMPSVLLAGAISLNIGSLHQAEHHLRHYLENNPDNLYARKMLASTLLRSGHTPDALTVLAPALKSAGQDVQLLALAGESYMQARDFGQATSYFEKASGLAPKAADLRTSLAFSKLGKGEQAPAVQDLQQAVKLDAGSHRAGIALVRTELGLGHVDKAWEAMVALEQAQPANAAVQELKGIVQLARKEPAAATASFNKALALQPSYYPAAANLAQQAMSAKDPPGAERHLRAFLDKNPASVEAMTGLATLASGARDTAQATQWLERASAVDPNAIAPAVNLIGQYLLIDQKNKALDLAGRLLVAHPDNPDLLDLMGKSELAIGDRNSALESYKKLAIALPRSAEAQMQVAALEMLLGRPAAAEDYLKTALAMRPDFPAAQLLMAELYVRKGSLHLALQVASRMQKQYPKAAAGFQLEGDVLMAQNRAAQALPLYEQAFGFSKTNELTIKIANALRVAGKPDEGARRLAQWLAQHPDDVRVLLFKAETMLADKKAAQAAGQLEAIVQRYPANVAALNNLALAYQQGGDARAAQVAEHAVKLAKDDPVVMDTYGWILVEQGEAARGLAILQKASALAPQARDIRYHVAAGLFRTGDKEAARKELDKLAAGNMQFAQAHEVRALIKKLD